MIRLVWLMFVGCALTVAGLWALLPASTVADFAILSGTGSPGSVLHTIGMSRAWGSLTWIIAMFGAGIIQNGALAGFGAAIVLGLYMYARKTEDREVASRKLVVEDHPGGEASPYVACRMVFRKLPTAFEPDAQAIHFRRATVHTDHEWVTPLEKELLGILAAHPEWPADVQGYHTESLYRHSLTVWKHAIKNCRSEGIAPQSPKATLARQLALLHDAGKLLAYTPSEDSWEKKSNRHRQLGLNVLRGLAAFWALDVAERHRLELAANMMLNGYAPQDREPEIEASIRIASVSDNLATRDHHASAGKTTTAGVGEDPVKGKAEAQAALEKLYVDTFESFRQEILDDLRINQSAGPNKAVALADFPDLVFVDSATFTARYLSLCESNGIDSLATSKEEARNRLLDIWARNGLLVLELGATKARVSHTFHLRTQDISLPRCICIRYKWPNKLTELVENHRQEYTLRGV
jgi:putative nucleotidyltransferase with HDIG domain